MAMGFSREKLMNLFTMDKKKIFSIGIIIITIVAALIIHGSQTKKIDSLRVERDAELKKNETLNDISRSEKTIKLYSNILSKKDAASVMNTLSGIAKESDITIVSIKPDTEENRTLYIRSPFSLVIETDNYHAIGKFISRIENNPDIYFVDAINIKAQEESPTPDKELTQMPKPANKLIVNLILSIIAFKG